MDFQYSGRRISGQKIKGKIEADSQRTALSQLEKDGLVIFNIEETKPWNKDIIIHKKAKNKDLVIFLRQYATLIHAGITISEATKTMMMQTDNHALRIALTNIDKKLEQGEPLSAAAKRHPKIFPALLVNMIHAGEVSGRLEEILTKMADYYEKQYRNRQKVISALLYPSVVGVITVILSIFLLVYIVPQFVTMFNQFGGEIPAYTQFILSLSQLAGNYWWILLLFAAAGILLYSYLKQFDLFMYAVDILKMRFPILGVLAHKGAMVRMTQTLSTLVNSSVPILKSIEITEKVVGNRVIENVLAETRKSLTVGDSLTTPMKEHWAFPALIIQMIQIGEKTGTMDHMLAKAAEFYEEEVDQLSNRIKILIEPLMIIILTILVGGIIAAVIMPMFGMFENI
ncbi:type II secretion system F family protein [Oceanobacillus massiliensis]|uniref:type II secretion system F family protein n=1 Tax=Oceanobacillus massiliensis TaxID=1465765 RepID=UPI00028929C5|nr:type II secretion system F family protein [Oceanobacillus massiliensis]